MQMTLSSAALWRPMESLELVKSDSMNHTCRHPTNVSSGLILLLYL